MDKDTPTAKRKPGGQPGARKTHCIHGHPRTPENIRPGGGCRECCNAQRRAKRAANRPDRSVRPCGHANTPENTYYRSNGSVKGCRPCALERERQRRGATAVTEGRAIQRPNPEWFPCGHPRTEENTRRTKNNCKTCHRESQRERYQQDPEASRRAASQWQKANRKRATDRQRNWRHNNLEHYRAYARKIYLARASGKYDPETLEYLTIIAADPCAYCGGEARSTDHIDPVKTGGPNHWTNYTPACAPCNRAKSATSLLAFLLNRR